MKLRSQPIHTEHGRDVARLPKRYAFKTKHVRNMGTKLTKHIRRTPVPDTGSEDARIALYIPLLDTEVLSVEVRRSWHVIFPEEDDM